MQNNPGPKPCNLVPKTLTTTPQPTTMCNRVQPCATYSCAPHNHVQPCATMCHHVQPRATMCNAPMCYPCAQPCATMCTHVQCTDVLPTCTLCKAPLCQDITIHELLHVKPHQKTLFGPETCILPLTASVSQVYGPTSCPASSF
jgi:hypothetical protein